MAQLTEYRLTFHSGFHLGRRGVNMEETGTHIPSDTLFAALLDALARCGGDLDAFIAPFPRLDGEAEEQTGDPPFRITSTFPFAGKVRFFPMPTGRQRWFGADVLKGRRKEITRLRFVSQDLFDEMLRGENLDGWLFPEKETAAPRTGVALQGGVFWLTEGECRQLPQAMRVNHKTGREIPPRALRRHRVYAESQVPRVRIGRITSASEIFHAGRVTMAPECGLWFGVEWCQPQSHVGPTNQTYRQAFNQAMTILQDDGLGGERSAGYGAFTWQEGASTCLDDPSPGGTMLLLSRYHPRTAELPDALNGQNTAYDLIPVGGWLRSWQGPAQRRKRLWMIGEGSIVQSVGTGPQGNLVDVHPTFGNPDGDLPHPVWRYGLALGVAFKGGAS